MFFSGISDEAGSGIETQIRAHRELGWGHLELRAIDGTNIAQVSDDTFDAVHAAVIEADMEVSCFASAIANWARPITGEFQCDTDDLKRAIPRMHRFGTPFIRIMSYPNHEKDPLSERDWRRESIRRCKELSRIAEDSGVILVHENCVGWGGESAENSIILLGEVDSPALKLVFDTGNPVTYGQNAWEYYHRVKQDIVYVHIKDAKVNPSGAELYVMCGDGDGYVKEIIGELLNDKYEGGLSIEPHLAAIIHTGETADPGKMYGSYVEYGARLMEIVKGGGGAFDSGG